MVMRGLVLRFRRTPRCTPDEEAQCVGVRQHMPKGTFYTDFKIPNFIGIVFKYIRNDSLFCAILPIVFYLKKKCGNDTYGKCGHPSFNFNMSARTLAEMKRIHCICEALCTLVLTMKMFTSYWRILL